MSVVGLDFGNQNAVLAAAGRGGVDVVLNGNTQRLNPCMVGFSGSRSMGEEAQITANSNFLNTISGIKHLIGLAYDDPRAQSEMKRHAFKCVPFPHPGKDTPASVAVQVEFNSETQVLPVEQVAGMMIKHMGSLAAKRSAEDVASATLQSAKDTPLSEPSHPLFPKDWVIAIPGYYTDAQRRALLTGCKIAGVTGVRRLMHEHTATALAYGIFKDIRKEFSKDAPATNVMFLDMGASTYSCCIVSYEQGKLTVRAARHDASLGGREFDELIAEWLKNKFVEKFGSKLSAKPESKPKVMLKLRAAAEKAKKTLSPHGVKEARVSLECLMDDCDFNAKLTAVEYEAMCAPLLARLKSPVDFALADAGMGIKDLATVEVVGGGMRVGCVKRALGEMLGLSGGMNYGLSSTMNADEAVARGAALQSAILSPRFKVLPYEIIERTPYSVRISWDENKSLGGDSAATEEGVEVCNAEVEGGEPDTIASSVIMFNPSSNQPCVRRVTLRRAGEFEVKASYEGGASEQFPTGVKTDICSFKIKAPEGSENKIRVNVKQDIHGSILLSSAQMVEEYFEEDVKMEESKDTKESAPPADKKKDEKKKDEKKKDDKKKDEKKTDDKLKDESKEGEAADPKAAEKKKKIRKTNLEFTETRELEWSEASINKAHEVEVAMSNVDRVFVETGQVRNDLESYIYDARDKISSSSGLSDYASNADKASFTSALEKMENWLYDEGYNATKSVYAEKLGELRAIGDPIEERQREASARPAAMSALQRTVEKYNAWINTNSSEEQYAHISVEEIKTAHTACDATASWMYKIMDKQGVLLPHETPVVKVDEINAKCKELAKVVSPIMHKPKPKPKVEEKTEEKKTEEEKKEQTAESEEPVPMETDASKTKTTPKDDSVPMDTSK